MSEKENINKKGALLAVLQILIDLSDEDHYLTYDQISQELEKRYNIIRARKAIADDISLLNSFGYITDKSPNGIGVAYLERNLNVTEVTYLVDSIYSSRSVPLKEAQQISNKLSSTLSLYQRQNYGFLKKTVTVNHTTNANVFYNIEIIQEAIQKKKKIKFQYLKINSKGDVAKKYDSYYYKVSPYYTVNNFGRYYLIANKEPYTGPSHYRIDYMSDIELISDSHIRNIREIEDLSITPIGQYISEHIYLFGGKVIDCKIKILNNRVLTDVKDWFGNNAKIIHDEESNTTYCTIRCDANALFYWTRQYGEMIEVISPDSLRERLYKELSIELERYRPKDEENK